MLAARRAQFAAIALASLLCLSSVLVLTGAPPGHARSLAPTAQASAAGPDQAPGSSLPAALFVDGAPVTVAGSAPGAALSGPSPTPHASVSEGPTVTTDPALVTGARAVAPSSPQYPVTFNETGLPSAGSWGVIINGVSFSEPAGTLITTALANGTHSYQIIDVAGWHQTTLPYLGEFTVSGGYNAPVLVFAQVLYPVTLTESGLPSDTIWGVNINGSLILGEAGVEPVSTSLPNGTVPYVVGDVSGWHQYTIPYGGNITVEAGPVTKGPLVFTAFDYPVTFSASGFTPGVPWTVWINLTQHVGAGNGPLTAALPNGTWNYTLVPVPGWVPDIAYTGGSTTFGEIAGAGIEVNVTFARFEYAVTFQEAGLPSGTTWSVKIGGGTYTASTGQPISASFPNGTYTYQIVDFTGWHQSTFPYQGSINVAGSPVSEPKLAFTQVTYAVTFTESGLPSGSSWGVTINGTPYERLAGAPVSSNLPNGTFTYTIGDVAGWHQTTVNPYSGTGHISNATVTFPTLAFGPFEYAVTFTTSGLAANVTWAVTVNSTHLAGMGDTSLSIDLPNGTWNYSLEPISGWEPKIPYSGGSATFGVIEGGPIGVAVPYVRVLYAVTFEETGLPTGTAWGVTISGSSPNASAPDPLTISLPNGTYGYTVGNVPGYRTTAYSGSVGVSGGPLAVPIAWSVTQYALRFVETGMPPSAGGGIDVNGSGITPFAPDAAVTYSEPNGTYPFTVLVAPGYELLSTAPSSPAAVQGSNLTVSIVFEAVYTVTFRESGLPSGANWSIDFAGTVRSSLASEIAFADLPNASYSFIVGAYAGYDATPSSGLAVVTGPPNPIAIEFDAISPGTYPATFTESGLPGGLLWSVTIHGSERTAISGQPIVEYLENGSFTYQVGNVAGWRQNTTPYTVQTATMPPSGFALTLLFTQVTYAVTFTETGLPSGVPWSVTINGTLERAIAPYAVVVTLPNGSFTYTISDVPGWHQTSEPYTEQNATQGPNGTRLALDFREVLYPVTFLETGLPSGTTYSVEINGTLYRGVAAGAPVAAELPNGTFRFTVMDVAGWHQSTVPYTEQNATESAAGYTKTLAFTPSVYPVRFSESGLPAGMNYTVVIDGRTYGATAGISTIVTELPNGTFSFAVGGTPGWRQSTYPYSPQNGTQGPRGFAAVLNFSFTVYAVEFDPTGIAAGVGWALVVTLTNLSNGTPGLRVGTSWFLNASGSFGTMYLPNGTFGFTLSAPGYVTENGSLRVLGGPTQQPVTVTSVGVGGGYAWWEWAILLAVVLLVIVGVLAWVIRAMKRQVEEESASPRSSIPASPEADSVPGGVPAPSVDTPRPGPPGPPR